MARPQGALSGRRILVTRPQAQAGDLKRALEAEGAEVVDVPVIRIVPLEDSREVDRAIGRLDRYAWVVFTSQNGVEAFCRRVEETTGDLRPLARARLAAIGPGTARALRARGLGVHLSPQEYRAEALVDELVRQGVGGLSILIPRAEAARPVLPEGLRRAGARVDVVAVYRTEVDHSARDRLLGHIGSGRVDAVTFTSGSAVRAWVDLLGQGVAGSPRRPLVACIGPVTASAARDYGLPVDVVAREYTVSGLVEALCEAFASPAPGG